MMCVWHKQDDDIDIIKVDCTGEKCEGIDWVQLAQSRTQW
jgi:hypothetical protein